MSYVGRYSGHRHEKTFCWDKDEIISFIFIALFDILGLLVCWWL